MDVGLVSAPIVFILMVSTTAVLSQILKGPVNALKSVGDNVTLKCVTRRNNCDGVEWSKMEGAQSARIVYRDGVILNPFRGERYNVSSTGGCNLAITQLKINDSGRFSCVLLVDGREETRSSILVVISVRESESCQSNVTRSSLAKGDGYSFSTAINVPAKSVEPSNVILSFINKAGGETEKMDDTQSLTVNATLTGIAGKEDITQLVCRAFLPPNSAAGFDSSNASLDVCATQQLIVSYPVENIAVSPSPGPYYKGATVHCTADGYPNPSFKWTHLKSGADVDGNTLVIDGETGDKYNCTATNTVDGKATSLNITIEVVASPEPDPNTTITVVSPDPACGSYCIGAIVVGVVAAIVATVATGFIVSKRRTP